MNFEETRDEPTKYLYLKERKVDLHEIDAVWYRRPRLVSLSKYGLGKDALEFARDEWKVFIDNIYRLMDNVLWVST